MGLLMAQIQSLVTPTILDALQILKSGWRKIIDYIAPQIYLFWNPWSLWEVASWWSNVVKDKMFIFI